MFLIVIDSFSKSPEVIVMKSTSATKTIDELRCLFSRWKIPEQIVIDNGPQFKSDEFKLFLSENGITHLIMAPYFPATNKQAERFVQTMKKALTAAEGESESVQFKLSRFLLTYCNAPHALFNESPAMLFFKRCLKTRLDLIQPKSEKVAKQKVLKQIESDKGREPIKFNVNQKVATLDHRHNDKNGLMAPLIQFLGI